jgi:hypothetical protein
VKQKGTLGKQWKGWRVLIIAPRTKQFDRPAGYEKKRKEKKHLKQFYEKINHSRQDKALEVKPIKFGQTGRLSSAAPETLKKGYCLGQRNR